MIFAALALAASAPSFDCEKAKSRVERLICSDPQLGRMDRYIGDRYKEESAYFSVHDPNAWTSIRLLQRTELRHRNRCFDRECIRKSYESQMHELFGSENNRFYKRADEHGYLHVDELGDGWIAIDVFVTSKDERADWMDHATSMLRVENGKAVQPASRNECGYIIQRTAEGWQLTRTRALEWPPCDKPAETFAGEYQLRVYPRPQ